MNTELKEYIIQAIRDLGGSEHFVPGASVGHRARRIANSAGVDFGAQLRASGYKFGDIIRLIQLEDNNIRIQLREASDFLIGFSTATEVDTSAFSQKLVRRDFYGAFSAVSTGSIFYHPEKDKIDNDPIEGIAIPKISESDAINLRRQFAKQLSQPQDADLEACLTSATPFKDFSKKIDELALRDAWRSFHRNNVVLRLTKWAADNALALQKKWFSSLNEEVSTSSRTHAYSIRQALGLLSENELEQILIPARLLAVIASRKNPD